MPVTICRLNSYKRLIEKSEVKIYELSRIKDSDIFIDLFKHVQVEPNWGNLIVFCEAMESESLPYEICNFIETHKQSLSEQKIDEQYYSEADFMRFLIASELNNKTLILLIGGKQIIGHEHLSDNTITEDRLEILISSHSIRFDIGTLEWISGEYKNLAYLYLSYNWASYKDATEMLNINHPAFIRLLDDKERPIEDKEWFISILTDHDLSINPDLSMAVADVILSGASNHNYIKLDQGILDYILLSANLSLEKRKLLLATQLQYHTWDTISQYLSEIAPDEFENIIDKRTRMVVKYTDENERLIIQLKNRDFIGAVDITEQKIDCRIRTSNLV